LTHHYDAVLSDSHTVIYRTSDYGLNLRAFITWGAL